MKIIKKYLSNKELEPIHQLLGEHVYMVYSERFRVNINLNLFESSCFSLSSKKGFFNFQTSWIDFDDYEYYQLHIEQTDNPKGIKKSEGGFMLPFSTINITPSSAIVKVELFEDKDEEEWNSEGRELITVKYDSSLLFTQQDEKQFLVGVSETIADLTLFIRDRQSIVEHLEPMKKRLEWK
ncbi:hypothetical protein EFA69_17415 [Rufibacter immobilis]|uniref:Uncharacterized protein n=1 Tax=Rufibacter immobilis TaxID=1348778 RepID=A0A3M9MQQ4_9BACT|nr:hypothetical protein [Rufibacter immobilis]RNI27872.1 hypothetical protein EFA69_17415 [Rufibacter immobilis]